ncbi:tyrosine phosphatase family-domain-containing protein [Massariosphaeria phaeospora]|uniref:diphosphoinositol-polyphosphate diphosphatase n=1 Tax=Massariosphaeria phaeospora TaxID=100035 RepID=A0A7C8MBM7_9PLEO|nr:tyrosine phosphatase family-domain-containing protein [Massariosphaeria phaeospora]
MYLESRPLPPPANFGTVVEEGIYRSSYPQAENFGFLKKLKLKTILTLVPEELSHEYRAFMVEAGIQHFHVHIPANKGEVKVQACQMSKALGILLDRSNHPVLVHCNKGKHRTGCVIGCFRRVQGTEMGSVIEEYHEYAGRKARLLDELVIENFDLGTVLWMARRYDWIQPGVEIELPSPATSTSIARS